MPSSSEAKELLDGQAAIHCSRQVAKATKAFRKMLKTHLDDFKERDTWKKRHTSVVDEGLDEGGEALDWSRRTDVLKDRIGDFLTAFDEAQFGLDLSKVCVERLRQVVDSLDSAAEIVGAWDEIAVQGSDQVFESLLECIQNLKVLGEEAERKLTECDKRGLEYKLELLRAPIHPDESKGEPVFRVLHLTDLHFGTRGRWAPWNHVYDKFVEDLGYLESEIGGDWDVLLLTGDITSSGKEDQFQEFDKKVLKRLWDRWIENGKRPPLLLAVPGNHDLLRPKKKSPAAKQLLKWDKDRSVVQDYWQEKEASYYHPVITEAFDNYMTWWKRQRHAKVARAPKKKEICEGFIPGDFSMKIKKPLGEDQPPLKIGIVGLNTAYLQLDDSDYLQRLAVASEQFDAACGGDGPKWARENDLCILMTHHPPTWLDDTCRENFFHQIFHPGRFAVLLNGHMHESKSSRAADHGQQERYQYIGSALYGREEVRGDPEKKRIHGYAGLRFDFRSEKATLRIWSRIAHEQLGWEFIDDPGLCIPKESAFRSSRPIDVSHACRRPAG